MDAHTILGVSKTATEQQIRAAYKGLAMKWHPDRHLQGREEATARFAEINEASTTMLRRLRRARREAEAKKSSSSSSPQSQTASSSSSADESTPSSNASESSYQNSESSRSTSPSSSGYSEHRYASNAAFDKSQPRNRSNSRSCSPPNPHADSPLPPPSEKSDDTSTTAASSTPHRNRLRKQPRPTKGQTDCKADDCTPKPFNLRRQRTLDGDPARVVETLRPGRALFRGTSNDSAKQWVHVLHMSLEDLYQGKTFYFRIIRYTLAGKKRIVPVDVYVLPGTRAGTEIVLAGVGHERKDGTRQDICFLVKEVEHPRFTRIRDDLLMEVRLPWIDKLNTDVGEVYLQGVDGREYMFPVNYCDDRILSGRVTLDGAGMPRQNGPGRGRIIVRWEIASPASSWDSIKNVLKFRNVLSKSQ